jgi:hypothetical protein
MLDALGWLSGVIVLGSLNGLAAVGQRGFYFHLKSQIADDIQLH